MQTTYKLQAAKILLGIIITAVGGCGHVESGPTKFEGCSNDWFQYVEDRVSTGDGHGHGPDLGSTEWRSTVEFRLGLRDDQAVPPLESDNWCEYINERI